MGYKNTTREPVANPALSNYISLKQELEQLERLRASIQRAEAADIARGIRSKRTPSPYAKIIDYYDRLINRHRAELQAVEACIAAVPDDTARELLRLRYIKGMTWDAISLAMNYSYSGVGKIHRKALTML